MTGIVAGCISKSPWANIPVMADVETDGDIDWVWKRHPLLKGSTLYYAAHGPLFKSLIHVPGSRDGFAGASFTLTMEDGERWHSPNGEMWASGEGYAAYLLNIPFFTGGSTYKLVPAPRKVGGVWRESYAVDISGPWLLEFLEDEDWTSEIKWYWPDDPAKERKPWLIGASAEQSAIIES